METDLFYYDPTRQNDKEYQQTCAAFCKALGITYLPTLDRQPSYHMFLDDGTFEGPCALTTDLMVRVSDRIFDASALVAFRKSPRNVLFVVDGKRVAGVVHICDYNKPEVLMFYYSFLIDFEKKLRELLILHGNTNDDMIEFYTSSINTFNGDLQAYYKKQSEELKKKKKIEWLKTLGDFQAFPISDLLWFANYKRYLILERGDIDELRELRNATMHGQDTVSTDGYLFSIDSLERHFSRIQLFREKYHQLLARIDEVTLPDRGIKNDAKWQVLKKFSQPVFQRSRLMWHYLED